MQLHRALLARALSKDLVERSRMRCQRTAELIAQSRQRLAGTKL